MTREFREVISHKSEIGNGMSMLMAIVPATDYKEGCVVVKLRWGFDSDTELVVYLSLADVATMLLVFDGYKTGVFELGGGTNASASLRRREVDGLYLLKIYSLDVAKKIALSMHEAVVVREILRTAIFRVVFG